MRRRVSVPQALLIALFVYYPVHPTVYAMLTRLFPSVPTPLFSAWQDLIIVSLFGLGVLQALRRPIVRIGLLDLAVGFWLATALPSALATEDARLSVYGFRLTYLPVLLYFAVRFLPFRDPIRYRQLVHIILGVSAAVAIAGILLYVAVPLPLLAAWYYANHFVMGYYEGIRRMDSVFWSAVVFGSLMAVSATLSLALAFSVPKARQVRNWYMAGFVLFSLCCLMSLSRGSWIAEATGIAVIALMKRRRCLGLALGIVLFLGAGGAVVAAIGGSDNPWIRQVASIFEAPELGTGQIGRAEQRAGGWEDIVQHPFGHGLGTSGHVAGWFGTPTTEAATVVTDNWYVKTWQESGVLGILCFFAFMLAVMWSVVASNGHVAPGFDQNLVLGVWAAFVGYSVQGYGSNVWDFYMVSSVFWVLLGIVANRARAAKAASVASTRHHAAPPDVASPIR